MVQTNQVLTWRIQGDMIDMPKGTDLQLLVPNDGERQRLALFVHKDRDMKTPHVVIEWLDHRRYVPVEALEALDENAAKMLAAARRTA